MNYVDAQNALLKSTETKTDVDIRIWVGLDGIYHDSDYPEDNDALVCYCGVSYSADTDDWIVVAWLYSEDCAAILKTPESARKMALFWLNWMKKIYGDDLDEPDFEADWLAVKSNRSVVMTLFSQEGEALKKELWNEESLDKPG